MIEWRYSRHIFKIKTHHTACWLLFTKYRPIIMVGLWYYIINQVWQSCWLWGILIMVGFVLSQLKPSELYNLSCENGLGLRPRPFSQLRLGFYPIHNCCSRYNKQYKNTEFRITRSTHLIILYLLSLIFTRKFTNINKLYKLRL